jgi:serpin B
VNAIYFKGRWRIPFDPKRTTPQPFLSAGGVSHDVPTMVLDEKVRFVSRQGLPPRTSCMANGAFAMTILLPDEGSTPGSLLTTLTPETWRELEASYQEARIVLFPSEVQAGVSPLAGGGPEGPRHGHRVRSGPG